MKIKINNHNIVIDDDDYNKIKQYSLWVHSKKGYVFCDKTINGSRTRIRLHRLIMEVNDPIVQVDHINLNKLDNRKINLRLCNNSQNHANMSLKRNNTSGYKGVSKMPNYKKKWRARCGGKTIGYFYTKKEAAKAYNIYALKMYGNFARINNV